MSYVGLALFGAGIGRRVLDACRATGLVDDYSVEEAQEGDHADGDGDDIAVMGDVVVLLAGERKEVDGNACGDEPVGIRESD